MTGIERLLRNFATEVETYVREKRSPQGSGAAAPESSYRQGHGETTTAAASAASSSTAQAPTHMHVPEAPGIADVPTSATVFSTVQSNVRAGAIRVEISDPEQWSPGHVIQSQEAKRAREIGSLIFETPIQHDY